MRKETQTIKLLLKELFPNEKFSIRLKEASNYVDTSDKIRVTCAGIIDAENIVDKLKQHTYGILVYKKGDISIIHGSSKSYIEMPNGDKVDMGMVEFIEVG